MSTAVRRLDPWPLLRSAPIALPQLLALLALVTLSAAEGGFPLEHWAPAAVLISLLLVVSLVALPVGERRAPYSRAAIVLITGFALWTAASLFWADDRGAAAVASTRTAFLAATFVLFARWRHTPRTATTILTVLTAGLGVFAWGVLLQLRGATDLDPWFLYDRLLEPIGYVNAGAAFWGVAAFLGVALLGGALSTPQRVIGALVAVPAAALSLLCLSRGGVLASGLVVVLLLAFLPGRARNGAAFLVAGLGLLVGLPQLLDVGDAVRTSAEAAGVLSGAIDRVIVGTVLAVLATLVWVGLERVVPIGDRRRDLAARGGAALIGVVAVLAVVVSLAGVGPFTVDKIETAADSITQPYEAAAASDSRLTAGLNSGRWDFWTVAWGQFEEAPFIGAGADNYRQDYLLSGQSPENPRYPHSIVLRTLGQLGLVGGALLFGWIGIVVLAVRRLGAGQDQAGRAVALGAGGAFGLWVIHGSADWLLEYGGLSAIVAAIAGLVVAAGPDTRARPESSPRLRTRHGMPLPEIGVPVGVMLLLIAAFWSGAQWVAERDRAAAAALAVDQPQRAIDRAERAHRLEPFGEQADQLLGALAVQRGDLPAARAAYLRAYDRNPLATRPRLWLGVLASAAGEDGEARRWLRRAARTAPRDPIVAELSAQVAAGETLDPRAVQAMLADRTAQLVRDPDPAAPASAPPPAVTAPAAAG